MSGRPFIFLTTFLLCLLVLPVTLAQAGVGGPYGEYDMAYQGSETLTLLVVPDGSGKTFDQAFLPFGGTEDATVTLFIWDAGGTPIAGFPAEDMWLESLDGGLVPCIGGTIADSNTDAAGSTTWATPLHAGGHSEALVEVLVNGGPLDSSPPGLALSFNSPDINGDLTVDLSDVPLFAEDYFSGYNFRSDFHRDGQLDLKDLVVLAQAYGANCP